MSSSVAKSVYSDMASFGTMYSFISAIMATVLGSIGLYVGWKFITHPEEASTPGLILEPSGACWQDGNPPQTFCSWKVSFYAAPNDKTSSAAYTEYVVNISSSRKGLQKGQVVTVYYDTKDPANTAVIDKVPWSTVGYTVAIISALVIAGSWLSYYLSRRYKFYGAAAGLAGGVRVVKAAL